MFGALNKPCLKFFLPRWGLVGRLPLGAKKSPGIWKIVIPNCTWRTWGQSRSWCIINIKVFYCSRKQDDKKYSTGRSYALWYQDGAGRNNKRIYLHILHSNRSAVSTFVCVYYDVFLITLVPDLIADLVNKPFYSFFTQWLGLLNDRKAADHDLILINPTAFVVQIKQRARYRGKVASNQPRLHS